MSKIVCSSVFALCLITHPSIAQQFSCTASTTSSAGGVIYGRVVNDSTNAPIVRRAVFLSGKGCTVIADNAGKFRFHSLTAGEYGVLPGPLGYRRMKPVTVAVVEGESTYVELRMRPENRVADCLDIAECASILKQLPSPELSTDSLRLRESALRTSVAILLGGGWKLGEFFTCIDEPNEAIAASIARTIPQVVARSECALGDSRAKEGYRRPSMSYHGQKAVAVTARVVSQREDAATVRMGNHVAELWAEGWTCEFKREKKDWIAVTCKMDWIS